MSEFDEARAAIYDRVKTLATDADPDALVKLADAVGKVEWGPQGGRQDTDYRYVCSYSGEQNGRAPGFFAS